MESLQCLKDNPRDVGDGTAQWRRRQWSAGADEGDVFVTRGDALNVAETGVL